MAKKNPIVIADKPEIYVSPYIGNYSKPKINCYKTKYFSKRHRGLNPYFSFNNENYDTSNEQNLVKMLQEEQIQIFGFKGTYIVKTSETVDKIYGESIGSNFKHTFPIEFIPENNPEAVNYNYSVEMYGYSQLDTFTLNVAFDRMNEELDRLNIPDRKFPMIGDLILFDLQGKLFEIKYVEEDYIQFAKGCKTVYKFDCQLFNLGQETFETGDKNIDYLNNFEHTHEYPNVDNDIIRDESKEVTLPEPNIWDLNLQKDVEFDKPLEPRHKNIISRKKAQKTTNTSEPKLDKFGH